MTGVTWRSREWEPGQDVLYKTEAILNKKIEMHNINSNKQNLKKKQISSY